MKEDFTHRLQIYSKWKADMIKNIKAYQDWLVKHELNDAEDDLRVFEVIDGLNSDSLTVAFVAEFSRGKTELINGIFFADYQRRLLPSAAGRTTMCPTELFYDLEADEAYIRLLPIETRADDMTIAEHKQNPMNWTTTPLDVASPGKMAEAFNEIVKLKSVSTDEAKRLGLYVEEPDEPPPSEVEIPLWRHALISFPHPMLKQGLVILDTPGLNAVGTEPELTMEMIPKAQAVTFILGADTGVTKSDSDIWKHHIIPHIDTEKTGITVALNKIDTLWDELKDESAVASNIAKQCQLTSKALNIEANKVFPVSAQKGLLAKIKQDPVLLEKSGLAALESFFSNNIVPAKQRIVRENVTTKIGGRIEGTKNLLVGRQDAAQQQLNELQSLSGKNTDVILQLMNKARDSQAEYKKNVENFQTSRHVLTQQVKTVLETLSIESLDKLIAKTRSEMVGSYTTAGMKKGMITFFDGAKYTMEQVSWQADKSNELVQAVYQRFRDEHNVKDIQPVLYSTKKYSAQLSRLHKEAEAFRNSGIMTMTEQSFVVKKFFVSLVSHARNIFFQARQDAETWAKSVMNPLAQRIKDRKKQLDQHLDSLKKIKSSREKLEEKIQELETMCADLGDQINTIDELLKAIYTPLPETEPTQSPKNTEKVAV
ncbi:MAG: hypothetical protein GXP19_10015 [Gammaproteobacteria bacterium]|nr:hypothetical protein [Gammaproteobacteria bacterium]